MTVSPEIGGAEGSTKTKPSLLLPLAFGHFAIDCAPGAIWLVAPAVAAAMGLSPAQLGLLITIQSVGAAVAYLPAGILGDRVADRGRLLLITFWWVAIGYGAASLASGFWMLAVLLAVGGMGDAAWHPVATGILAGEYPSRRAHALGAHGMGGTLSQVFAPLAVGFLLEYVDWRVALQLSVLPSVLMGLVFFRLSRAVPRMTGPRLTRADLFAVWRTWRRPAGLRVIALIGVYNMALIALFSMTPLFLQKEHGLTSGETGLAFSIMMFAGALAQPVIGRLSDRTSRRPVIVLGNGLAALAAVGVWLSGSLVVVLLLQVAAIAFLVGIRPVLLASAVEHAGSRETTTLGMAFAFMDGIGALGAVLAGWVGSFDLAYAYLFAAGLSAAAVVIGLKTAGKPAPTYR